MKNATIVCLKSFALTCLMMLFFASCNHLAHSETNPLNGLSDQKAINCILGEVRGEYTKYGYKSFLALADALRNRLDSGLTTKGVYGCYAEFSKEMPYIKAKSLDKEALKAWRESATVNYVKGAQYWGGVGLDDAWMRKMEKSGYKLTKQIGNTRYYRKD